MPTTVTIGDVFRRTGMIARGLEDSSAFLVDGWLSPVGDIKVYGTAIADLFQQMHIDCHLPEPACLSVATILSQELRTVTEAVNEYGYLIVEGEPPLGHDYEHLAPRLLLLGSIEQAERSWREGLARRARLVLEQLT